MTIGAVIAAGGMGQRFGHHGGKQLFEYKGKPILVHTVEKFLGLVDEIVVVIQEADIPLFQRLAEEHDLSLRAVVPSGEERYDSVITGLRALSKEVNQVLVHDGARPNVSPGLICSILGALNEHSAVIPVLPVKDTIKVVCNQQVDHTPPRCQLYSAQTPQGFNKNLLLQAYEHLLASQNLQGVTDDAMAIERFGKPVATVLGEEGNLKVTVKEDVRFLDNLI